MSMFVAMALWIAVWLVVSALARTDAGARLGLALVVLALPMPWFVHAHYALRVTLAFALGFLFVSAVDFAAGRKPASFRGRLLYILAVFALIDVMSAVPMRRRFDRTAATHLVIAILCGFVVIAILRLRDPKIVPLRMAAAAALIMVVAEVTSELVRLISAACGVRFANVHDHPHLSRTVTEFWSCRWNLFGARWFRQHVYLWLRRTNPTLALFALFAVSAVLHIYLIAAVVPIKWMLMCAAFFLAQPVLIVIERRLRIRRWPAIAAHVWTIATLVALLPLVLAPLLAALEMSL